MRQRDHARRAGDPTRGLRIAVLRRRIHRVPSCRRAGDGWLKRVIRASLTATSHVLVTRSGAALQPGPRRYTRSWIRDGAMMSAALLRMGHAEGVRELI